MNYVQVSARVSPELKQAFEKKVKSYGLSMNSFMTLVMHMVAQGRLNLDLSLDHDVWTVDMEQSYQSGMQEYRDGETVALETWMDET
jgi:antitoxin component of RelBE/YafQ-DinJ toxin-antitoxin module